MFLRPCCNRAAAVMLRVPAPLRRDSSTTPTLSGIKETKEKLSEISFFTTLYWLFGKGYLRKTHQMQIEHRNIYGPLWRSKFGPLRIVNVASAELIEQVLRHEGQHPVRTDMPHWRTYREIRNHAYGPLTEILFPYITTNWMLEIVLMDRWVKNTRPATEYLYDSAWMCTSKYLMCLFPQLDFLYCVCVEGICSVLFETRMGCLNENIPEETQKFIFSVGEMFRISSFIVLFPKYTWPYLPFWRYFVSLWDHLFKVAHTLVEQKMTEIQEKMKQGGPMEGTYLTHLLVTKQMSMHEVLGSITELLLAGVDTTSNTTSWALYHLAREPHIQEKLNQEVNSVCPGDKVPDSSDFARMPWLKAIVKETLRMYPVVPSNARLIIENETTVGGYTFPKNTLFHLCHYAVSYDEQHFLQPHSFLPERWLRDQKFKHHAFSSVPFGFGVRGCLGRRVAELEMHLILSRLVKHYELRPDPSGATVEPVTRTLLAPAKPINLQFVNRKPL
ncbi:sterol 26-hydroxylase, mitochondrial-like [Arapaima gigas]